MPDWSSYFPFVILAVGLTIVIVGIAKLRINAFLALITAAMVVSVMAPGEWEAKTGRVAEAFGKTATGIGIVIALAAIIGKAMMDSGAADRIVQMFLNLFGERNSAGALTASGFTLAIPVFFDTVFYLLVPLARSMYRQTGKRYVLYLGAIAASAAAHALVPPTPGPLLVADAFHVDLSTMILMGLAVAAPAAACGLLYAAWVDRRIALETPPGVESEVDAGSTVAAEGAARTLPSLGLSLAPIVAPIVLITLSAVCKSAAAAYATPPDWLTHATRWTALIGNPNFALLAAAVIALYGYVKTQNPTRRQVAHAVEEALMNGGVIILITCAGGAFGGMLQQAQLNTAIQTLFGDSAVQGYGLLWLAFAVSSLLKFAQGSTTTAMIVTSQMFAAMIVPAQLGYHPVYLALAVGSGGLVGSWMNDSGFWIFAKMGGLTEVETLKTWTPLLAILGISAMLATALLAWQMPMPLPAEALSVTP
ncbi:MAG: gluconate permease [Planctomycetales bacterium]|nr:gluconate permease [Planctomycetales bacterium]